jgi:hypothetical protein
VCWGDIFYSISHHILIEIIVSNVRSFLAGWFRLAWSHPRDYHPFF